MKKTILAAGLALVAAGIGLNNAQAAEQKVDELVYIGASGFGLNLDAAYATTLPERSQEASKFGFGIGPGISINGLGLIGGYKGTRAHSEFSGLVSRLDTRFGYQHVGISFDLGWGWGTRKYDTLEQYSVGGGFSGDVYSLNILESNARDFRASGAVLGAIEAFARYDKRTVGQYFTWGWYTSATAKIGTGVGVGIQVGVTWGLPSRYGLGQN